MVYTDETNFGSLADVQCNFGFTYIPFNSTDPSPSECLAAGDWFPQVGTCDSECRDEFTEIALAQMNSPAHAIDILYYVRSLEHVCTRQAVLSQACPVCASKLTHVQRVKHYTSLAEKVLMDFFFLTLPSLQWWTVDLSLTPSMVL